MPSIPHGHAELLKDWQKLKYVRNVSQKAAMEGSAPLGIFSQIAGRFGSGHVGSRRLNLAQSIGNRIFLKSVRNNFQQDFIKDNDNRLQRKRILNCDTVSYLQLKLP